MDDAVLLLLLGTAPRPLTDARPAGIGEDVGTHLVEGVQHTVPLEGVTHQLGSRGDGQLALALDTGLNRSRSERGASGDVFVARIGARTNQAVFNLGGVSLLGAELSHLAHRRGEVRAERAVEVGLEGAQVNLNHLVEVLLGVGVHLGVACEVLGDSVSQIRHIGTAGGPQVAGHALIVSKRRGGRADLCPHVANGALSGAAHGVGAFAEVLDDATRSALHREDAGHLEDDVLGAGPTAHLAGQLDADQFGEFQLPGHAGHDVHGVGTAHTDGDHSQTTRIHGMAIRSDHHAAWEGVVLEHHLVDDAGAGLPEPDAILVGDGLEEIVDLVVAVDGLLEVRVRADLGLDQVVAMHRGRHGRLGFSSLHELQQGHLRGGILHGHTVGRKVHVIRTPGEGGLGLSLPQVGVQNLLGEGQGVACGLTGGGDAAREALIRGADHLQIKHLESVVALGRRRYACP